MADRQRHSKATVCQSCYGYESRSCGRCNGTGLAGGWIHGDHVRAGRTYESVFYGAVRVDRKDRSIVYATGPDGESLTFARCASFLPVGPATDSEKCIAAGGHYRDNQDRCHRCGADVDEMGAEVSP